MRYVLLLLLPLLAACGDHAHDHPAVPGAHDHGHAHDCPVVTLLIEGDATRLWGHLNAIAARLTSPGNETTRATRATDAANLAALARALETLTRTLPDADRTTGMLANLARAADQLAHQADEGGPVDELIGRLTDVLRLARRLDPASSSPALEPTYILGPSGGILTELRNASNQPVGWVEVKLHGDAGNLELWLATDQRLVLPLRVPVGAVAKLELLGPGRTVELRVRDTLTNKDEQGRVTIFEGRTHHFIFPGETGADAAWLKGENFQSPARLSIQDFEATFELKPH